jgi:hypothetical protein
MRTSTLDLVIAWIIGIMGMAAAIVYLSLILYAVAKGFHVV